MVTKQQILNAIEAGQRLTERSERNTLASIESVGTLATTLLTDVQAEIGAVNTKLGELNKQIEELKASSGNLTPEQLAQLEAISTTLTEATTEITTETGTV